MGLNGSWLLGVVFEIPVRQRGTGCSHGGVGEHYADEGQVVPRSWKKTTAELTGCDCLEPGSVVRSFQSAGLPAGTGGGRLFFLC